MNRLITNLHSSSLIKIDLGMDRLKAWGIDGGITDFPDVVR